MKGKEIFSKCLSFLFIILFLVLPQHVSGSEDNKQSSDCLNEAFERIREIESLPEMKYLHTLDGQKVLLNEFYSKCLFSFPKCSLYRKFYYWQSEIKEAVSNTEIGLIKYTVRCYYNCVSTFCPKSCDPRKTNGDVAEFYDHKGNFIGLEVHRKDGKYFSLPYDDYKKPYDELKKLTDVICYQ